MHCKVCFGLIGLLTFCRFGYAQTATKPVQIVELPSVLVKSPQKIVKLSSGSFERNTTPVISPGAAYAVYFASPAAGSYFLNSLTIHLAKPYAKYESGLRIQLLSAAVSFSPQGKTLAPPIIFTPEQLERFRGAIKLKWPSQQVIVPDSGIVVVIQGVGQTLEEYTNGFRAGKPGQPIDFYLSAHRDSPTAGRWVSLKAVPALKGAKVTDVVPIWALKQTTQQWIRQKADYIAPFIETELRLTAQP